MAKHPHWSETPPIPETPLEKLMKEHMALQAVYHQELMAALKALQPPAKPFDLSSMTSVLIKKDSGELQPGSIRVYGGAPPEPDAPNPQAPRFPVGPHFDAPKKTGDIINQMWKNAQK